MRSLQCFSLALHVVGRGGPRGWWGMGLLDAIVAHSVAMIVYRSEGASEHLHVFGEGAGASAQPCVWGGRWGQRRRSSRGPPARTFWVFCVWFCVLFCGVSGCARVRGLVVACAWDVVGRVRGGSLVSNPPRMHALAPCSLHVRVCAIYLFTLTIP